MYCIYMAYFGLKIKDSQESTTALISKVTGGIRYVLQNPHVAILKLKFMAVHRKLAVTRK